VATASQCLGVVDKNVGDGTLVSSVPCDTKDALTGWDLAVGDNLSVRLTGTNYCLDAGTSEHILVATDDGRRLTARSYRPPQQRRAQDLDLLPRSGPAALVAHR
jgi:hypothetical protein